jgi:hypothetical protein
LVSDSSAMAGVWRGRRRRARVRMEVGREKGGCQDEGCVAEA